MSYSTKYDYTEETLNEVATFCWEWDKTFKTKSERLEKVLLDEMHLYLQYMFINLAPSPLKPSKELLLQWLAPTKGLVLYQIRLEILKRLYQYTKASNFHFPEPDINYPSWKELIFWRAYHQKLFNQSRALFQKITTEDIVRSELRLWPFYDAMTLYEKKKQVNSADDFFLESHQEVADLIEPLFSKEKEIKILDIGCGDGRLLLHLRQKFPFASLYATNFFETTGIQPKLLQDPNFHLKVCTLEEMDFPSEFFDVIVSTEVIEHLRRPTDMIEKIKKHLRPQGVFVVTAPSVHTRFLSPNPITYLAGVVSVLFEKVLPPFHQLYEATTDLPIVHYAFSHQEFHRMFANYFSDFTIATSRFTHLRKFRLHKRAAQLPILKKFGGLVMAWGRKSI
ncbi:MAG: class I SAM-dependent methyltransferase [Bacteriovoracaceae bacterium]